MVGVPGRSRAFITCKKRKVGCDGQHPECGSCIRSKRVCEGYGCEYVFVHNEPDSHRSVYKKPTEVAVQPRRPRAWCELKFGGHLVKATPSSGPISMAAAMQHQLLSSAIGSDSAEVLQTQPMWRLWRLSLLSCLDSPTMLHAAPLASYLALLGRRDCAPRLIDGSRQLYLRGLREVVCALRRVDTALRDETLAACVSLVLYETIECPERSMKGYNAHVQGCLSLIEKRGPRAHQDGLGHALFTSIRLVGALFSLAKHEPSFLASGPWISVPWELHPKKALDQLVDILLQSPKILKMADKLNSIPPDQTLPKIVGILEHCVWIDKELDSFYSHLKEIFETPWYWEKPNCLAETTKNIPSPFPTIFHFSSLEYAHVLTLYWASRCLLLSGILDLHQGLEKSGFTSCQAVSPAAKSLIDRRYQYHTMASNVCRSVDYCVHADHSGTGSMRIASSFDIVIAVMRGRKDSEREFAWALARRTQIGDQWLRLLNHEDEY